MMAQDNMKGMKGDRKSGSQQHQQSHTNPGNFANDREKAAEAGRKGGKSSGGNHQKS